MFKAIKVTLYAAIIWSACIVMAWCAMVIANDSTTAINWHETSSLAKMFIALMVTLVPFGLLDLALESDKAHKLNKEA